MNHEKRKTIVNKLLKDELTEGEQQSLLHSNEIEGFMRYQWDSRDEMDNPVLGSTIFSNIKKNIWDNSLAKKVRYYKLSLAASIALLLGLSGYSFFFSPNHSTRHIYVAATGIQNMESVTLPDGSVVQLGPGSKLTYPEKFQGKTREVSLNGQAFFDIEPGKNKPFIVHTSQMDITVLGTAFELFSYEIENTIEAILLKGKISVEVPGDAPGRKSQIVINPNEKLTFDKQSKTLSKETVDAGKYTAWRNRGILTFENEKLSMIIPRLEQWYGRKIICRKEIADKYHFTFKIRDESLERILFIMGASSPIKYDKTEGGDFILKVK